LVHSLSWADRPTPVPPAWADQLEWASSSQTLPREQRQPMPVSYSVDAGASRNDFVARSDVVPVPLFSASLR